MSVFTTRILGRLSRLQQHPDNGYPARKESQQEHGGAQHDRQGSYGQYYRERGPSNGDRFLLHTFDYSREDMADRILETLQTLSFRGVSVSIYKFLAILFPYFLYVLRSLTLRKCKRSVGMDRILSGCWLHILVTS